MISRATRTRRIRKTRKHNYKAEESDVADEDKGKGKDNSSIRIRGERIIRYSNIIRIIFEYQNIRIRIRSIFSNRIIFVFVFG